MRRARALALGALVLAGCGSKGAAPRDAGDGGAKDSGAPAGLLGFEVEVMLKVDPTSEGVTILPGAMALSLALDVEGGVMIAGGVGNGSAAPMTTADGKTFRSKGPLVLVTQMLTCVRLNSITFESLEVTVTETSLAGHAAGKGIFMGIIGDDTALPFTAEITGTRDVTAPFLVVRGDVPALPPFGPVTVLASEPLPVGTTARLVGSDGSSFDMVPDVGTGSVPFVSRFDLRDAVLSPGAGYSVEADGLVDFVGNADTAKAPLRLGVAPAVPLAAQDGFESLTGASFGGTGVVRGGDLTPISGAQSLYIGGPGTPGHDVYMQEPTLLVRLAMKPGDTKLRFTYRTVSAFGALAFDGTVVLGSPGGKASQPKLTFPPPPSSTVVEWLGLDITIGADQTAEVALPADAHDEVVVAISTLESGCTPSVLAIGIVIDDLRLE